MGAKNSSVDYNSWIDSDHARKLASSLDKDVVLAEGMYLDVENIGVCSKLL